MQFIDTILTQWPCERLKQLCCLWLSAHVVGTYLGTYPYEPTDKRLKKCTEMSSWLSFTKFYVVKLAINNKPKGSNSHPPVGNRLDVQTQKSPHTQATPSSNQTNICPRECVMAKLCRNRASTITGYGRTDGQTYRPQT